MKNKKMIKTLTPNTQPANKSATPPSPPTADQPLITGVEKEPWVHYLMYETNTRESGRQWHDDSCNVVAGCNPGCELYPTTSELARWILLCVPDDPHARLSAAMELDKQGFLRMQPSEIFHRRHQIAERIVKERGEEGSKQRKAIESTIVRSFRCKAGILHLQHGMDPTNPDRMPKAGFSPTFEQVTLFPGRAAAMASMDDLTGTSRPDKPWLDGLPRLIKLGDLGDLLSSGVPFEFLRDEVVLPVISPAGRRHIWLWATRRSFDMLTFARWLRKEGIAWPRNLVPMASMVNDKLTKGVCHLRKIRAAVRGVVINHMWDVRNLHLKGFSWVIADCSINDRSVKSGWVESVAIRCRAAGCAFFIQYPDITPWDGGRRWGLDDGQEAALEYNDNTHIREVPGEFRLFLGAGETSQKDFNARLAEFSVKEQQRLVTLSARVDMERRARFVVLEAIMREEFGILRDGEESRPVDGGISAIA